jgi:parallel beta-helix repeat protein
MATVKKSFLVLAGALAATSLMIGSANAQSFGGFPTITKQEEAKKQARKKASEAEEEEEAAPNYLVVDSRARAGENTYTSIQKAVDAVAHGGVVVVLPGEYRENLDIRKPVNIQGDRGPGGRVRIIPTDSTKPCLNYNPYNQSDHTLVSNVEFQTLRKPQVVSYKPAEEDITKVSNFSGDAPACVAIKSGVFTMKETTVDGGRTHAGAMVEIAGGTAFMEKNTIRGGSDGILVNQTHPLWDRTLLVDNEITDNRFNGLHLVGQSSMLVTGNMINSNGQGIKYNGEGAATLVGNKILNNRGTGVLLDRRAKQVLLRLNQIWSNEGDGVKIFQANGLIEDNDIDGNGGVEINTEFLIGNEPKIFNDVGVNAKSYTRSRKRR